MRFVLAPDSFKESMSASTAALAMRTGVLRALPGASIDSAPVSDGGEGLVDALLGAMGGRRVTAAVSDPLGRPAAAVFGYVEAQRLAILEVAAACGIGLIDRASRDPRLTTTYGVGELIRAAMGLGAERCIIGLGGTCTNDAGAGMLQALGVSLTDTGGAELPPGGAALARLHAIDPSGLDPRLGSMQFELACDVANPLLGPEGASRVFGPQKGATPEAVEELEAALTRFAAVAARSPLGPAAIDAPGAGGDAPGAAIDAPGVGAGGGLGAAFSWFLGARLDRGIDIVLRATRLAERIQQADIVFTGEGTLDAQTLMGKAPLGVARVAARCGVPVIGFAGSIGGGADQLLEQGFAALVPIVQSVCDLQTALRQGEENLERAAERACRLLVAGAKAQQLG